MNITVYLGAKEGNDPGLKEAVRELETPKYRVIKCAVKWFHIY